MPPTPPEQAPEAIQQSDAKKQRIALAFVEVFGTATKRSASQKLVLEQLAKNGSDDENTFNFNTRGDGLAIALAAAQKDGAKTNFRIIERQLAIAARVRDKPREKPKTTR